MMITCVIVVQMRQNHILDRLRIKTKLLYCSTRADQKFTIPFSGNHSVKPGIND